jgi:hypothetical protein
MATEEAAVEVRRLLMSKSSPEHRTVNAVAVERPRNDPAVKPGVRGGRRLFERDRDRARQPAVDGDEVAVVGDRYRVVGCMSLGTILIG